MKPAFADESDGLWGGNGFAGVWVPSCLSWQNSAEGYGLLATSSCRGMNNYESAMNEFPWSS